MEQQNNSPASDVRPVRSVALQQPASKLGEVVIPMTHALLEEAMHKAADRATAVARAQATRELKQSLDAQAAAKDEERERALSAQKAALEDQMIHRVRAARLWSALVAFAIGAVGVGGVMAGIERTRLAAGADVGIDAMAKSRMLDDMLERAEEEPCDAEHGCAPGQTLPNGRTFRSPEPPDAEPRR